MKQDTTKTFLVVFVAMAILFVGLSAFANPSLSSDDRGVGTGTSELDRASEIEKTAAISGSDGNNDEDIIRASLVKGEVLDQSNRPIAGAQVTLIGPFGLEESEPVIDNIIIEEIDDTEATKDSDNSDIFIKEWPYGRITYTNDFGVFVFKGVPDGNYVLKVGAEGFHPHQQRLHVQGDTKVTIYLRPTFSFNLHATPIDGDGDGIADDVIVFTSTGTGRPLGGVMIYIDGVYEGSTSFEGWLFAMDFAPGYHRVRGLYHQYEAFTSFWIQGQVQPVYGALKGVVFGDDPTDPTHNPIAGAKVEIFRPYPIPYPIEGEEDTGDNDDTFPGVDTDDNGYSGSKKDFEMVNVDGDRGSGANELESQPELLRYYASTTTDRNGEFSFEKVPAGSFMMRVTARGYHQSREIVFIRAGQVTYTKTVLKPILPGSLKGVVLEDDPNGHMIPPIPGARVEIFRPYPIPYPVPDPREEPVVQSEGNFDDYMLMDDTDEIGNVKPYKYYEFRITDENGAFDFSKVPEGTYMMRVTARGFHGTHQLVTVKAGEVTWVKVLLKPILPGSLKGHVLEYNPINPVIIPIASAKVEIYSPYLQPVKEVQDSVEPKIMTTDTSLVTDVETAIDPSVLYYDVRYTHDDGSFIFQEVPEGRYAIRVTARGYLDYRGFVTIREGQVTELRILLKPITWGTLKGLVYEDDPNGPSIKPIEGALVEIYSLYPYPVVAEADVFEKPVKEVYSTSSMIVKDEELGLWRDFDDVGYAHNADPDCVVRYYAKTRTDENGEFSFERVPAGVYVIRVSADGYENYRGKVQIKANEVTYKRIPLTLITTGILRGYVLGEDPTGPAINPIAGAKVEIFSPFPTPYPAEEDLWNIDDPSSGGLSLADQLKRMPVMYYDHTFTDSTGAFEFPEVPEGKYMMRVTHPLWKGHKEIVVIKANEVTNVRVMLKPVETGRLEGIVYGEEWAGGPINPVGNAYVIIWNQWYWTWTKTDKSGGFFMDDIPEGTYTLYVYGQGFWPYRQETVIRGGETTYARIILKPVVEKGHLTGNVYGVKEPMGWIVPVEGAKLKLVNHGNTFETTTGEDGDFSFEFVPEGEYILYVEADGWRAYKEEVTIRGGETTYTRIFLKPAPQYGNLVGVVMGTHGEPVGPAKVTLFDEWYMESTIVDRSGNFKFGKVPAGEYWLTATAEGFEEKTIRVEILPDQTTEVKIELIPLGG